MALIGELIAKLDANTKSFDSKMSESMNKLSNFGKNAAKVGAGIALAIGTVAVAGFTKLLNIINETEDKISNFVDIASKFDSSVAGLQKLDFIAKLSGGNLSDVESGLSKIVMSLKSLDEGTKSTVEAFGKLGLSQDMLKGKKIDEVYLLVAERLKGVTDSTERAKIAAEIFGKSWSSQINIVNSDIDRLSKKFDSFGGPLTEEQAKAVDSYGDSITELGAIYEVFKTQLTANVAPALEKIVNWISDVTLKMGGLGPVANAAAQYFVSGLQVIVGGVQNVIDVINGIQLSFKLAQKALLEFMQSFSELNFEVLGGELNLDRIDKLTQLNKEINTMKQAGRITDPLQSGLQSVQSSLQQQQTQQVNVKISTEKGLKAEVAESPEVTRKINEMLGLTTERAD